MAHSPPRPPDADAPERLQALLDDLPAPLQPLDASGLDGFLCGVLVQPRRIAEPAWWPHVLDLEARPPPPGLATAPLRAQVLRRHAELEAAISARRWFDPWVFAHGDDDDNDEEDAITPAVQPWAFGFSLALEAFPALLERDDDEVTGPLALLYRHLDIDHLEEAEALQAEIESLEPPASLEVAVEELVRATLLLADAAGLPKR